MMLLTPNPLLIQTAAWLPGQRVLLPLLLQNLTFGGFPSWNKGGAQLTWTATTMSEGKIIARGQQPIVADTIVQGDTGLLANVNFTLPAVIAAYDTLTVSAELSLDGEKWASGWSLGVFPKLTSAQCTIPVFASAELLSATRLHCSNAAPMPAAEKLPRTPFVVVSGRDGIDDAAAAALTAAGGVSVMLSPSLTSGNFLACTGLQSIQTVANIDTFHQPWWSSPGSVCSLLYNSSLVRDYWKFKTSFIPFPLSELVTNATAYNLDNVTLSAVESMQVHVRNVPVDSTDKTTCNGGNGCGAQMTTVTDTPLVFEAPFLKNVTTSGGALAAKRATALVCGLDIFNASFLPKSPQAQWAFGSMIDYAVHTSVALKTDDQADPQTRPTQQPTGSAQRTPVHASNPLFKQSTPQESHIDNGNPNISPPSPNGTDKSGPGASDVPCTGDGMLCDG